MPNMTLAWLAIYFGGMALAAINPLSGLITYLFEYYLHPPLHWWGDPLPNLRWNLMIAVATTLSFFAYRSSLPEMLDISNKALRYLLALGVLMVVVSATVAVNPALSWEWTNQYWKLIIIYALIIGIVRSQWAFDAFVMMHIAGAGWWGWEAFKNPERVGSRLLNVGSSDTTSDNLAAAHLLTVLPFIVIVLLTDKQKPRRLLALIAAPFIINTFILCNSRGATVGLVAALAGAVLLVKSRQRIRMIGVGVAVAAAFLLLADPQFVARQQTTTNPDDPAANDRLISWQAGYRLVKDHPFGTGGKGFHELSPIYIPDIVEAHDGEKRAPHNSYVLIASEWGVLGLALFATFVMTTFSMLRSVQKRDETEGWFYYRSIATQLALIGTLVAATFSDRFYGESIYWMCGLAFALYRVHHTALAASAAAVPTAEAAASTTAGFDRRFRPELSL
jgi:putative inorganic carbon (hco3(-)) transporter